MKNTSKFLAALVLVSLTTSCGDDFFDINENPNSLTLESATPNAILAQALKVTADNYGLTLNTYGSWTAGYWGKTGTVNGYNPERTYTYSSTYQQGLWGSVYDNIKDYDNIEKNGADLGLVYISSIGKIMKVLNYQLLVDQYGDIPYSQSLQSDSPTPILAPQYDKAEDIYKDLVVKLDEAIAAIRTPGANAVAVGPEDIVFGGTMANWVRFANTLKLRILLRQSFVPALDGYVRAEMTKLQAQLAPEGFTTTDVAAQPGYLQTAGKQNPFWNAYRANPAGARIAQSNYQAGTQYIIDQYEQNSDPRVSQLYVLATAGAFNGKYKGVVLGDPNPLPGGTQISRWKDYGGILKGFDASTPLMLAAESYFLQAEAKSRGFLTGGDAGAKTDFNNGIRASFVYFYAPAPSRAATTSNVSANAVADYTKYLTANTTNGLVDWDAATTTLGVPAGSTTRPVSKLEKIIYQKYLAMNSVTAIEAWNEYRRTTFPKFPASLQSSSPRADKLPVRLLYPQTEISTNFSNIPENINQFTSKIFWDVMD
ncbi:SusD/RagB family nutrient-binding outer membrane lipoprotein [Hymenobacter tibetensis]|uniref:SusD/RagB family nutrient-binding outer membrane lipoprotein n=1 Tax=Hymenobacter tibetensis TaxID=497967 RepID=A0ABY4D7V7_9BACT|nr:SusD/RagB family nutrient-binding outer membrane lipoprotein [Hymenobacter tibetensis]UOG76073.1 SusD/RagB family nutrient-binding outer membrane lipoprotein [Hymenobacter tibetensis]